VSIWMCMGWRPHRQRLAHELLMPNPRRFADRPSLSQKTLVMYVDSELA
jgi:hypothetical protein